jgi:hypothetical protein
VVWADTVDFGDDEPDGPLAGADPDGPAVDDESALSAVDSALAGAEVLASSEPSEVESAIATP